MTDNQLPVAAFLRRTFLLLWLKNALLLLTLWTFLWGLVILLARITTQMPRTPLTWGLLGIPPALLLAAWLALRKLPSRPVVHALIDKHNHAGGLVMARQQLDTAAWLDHCPALAQPRLHWQGRRPIALFVLALAFLLVSFLLPQRYINLTPPGQLNIGSEAETLTAQIETLDEEDIITDPQARQWQEKLDNLRRNKTSLDPAQTWEALDHLAENVDQAARQAAESALRQTEKLSRTAELTQSLAQAAPDLTAEHQTRLMNELTQHLADLAADNQALTRQLSDTLKKALENNTLNPADLAKLAQACNLARLDNLEILEKLCQAGLCDKKTLSQCQSLCQSLNPDAQKALAQFLKENADTASLAQALAMCAGACPGSGGVNRGRADAPLTWTDPSDPTDTAFKEQILPPAQLDALQNAPLAGLSTADPTLNEQPEASLGSGLDSSAPADSSALSRRILPRHRPAVRRFFDRRSQQP